MSLRDYLAQSAEVLERASSAISQSAMEAVIECIVAALSADRPLLVCGNGGSAADAMHITGELVARFLRDRRAFRVICLSENPVVLTAWSNDVTFETVFARQVEAYGGEGAVLRASWPQSDPGLAEEDELEIPVQINGKLVTVVRVPADADAKTLEAAALADEKVQARIAGKTVVKVIVVPRKLVNLVVR